MPSHIPHHEEVVVCDRRWIVKESTLHPSVGLGLFSCQDIDLPQFPRQVDKKALFPYCGMYYPLSKWNVLSRCHPTFRMYCVSADSYPEEDDRRPPQPEEGYRMVDGDPMRSSNIAAYINSVSIPRSLRHMMGRRREPNVDFVFVDGCPKSAEKFLVAVRQ